MSLREHAIELELRQFKYHHRKLIQCEERLFDIAEELKGDCYVSPQFKSKELATYQKSPKIYKSNISELICEEEELIEQRDYHLYAIKIVANYLQNLNHKQVNIVEMYYYKGFTLEEIGKKIYRSKSQVQRDLRDITEKLANL